MSREIRQNAGRTEQYLIRLPSDLLLRAGVPLPVDPAVAKEQAQNVIGKMTQAVTYRVELERETRKVAAAQVTVAREEARRSDEVIEARLLQALSGVTPEQADRLNMVLPGTKTETTVWRATQRRIENVINKQAPVTGYIVVSESDAEHFKDANGNYRTDIPPGEIEPLLYKGDGSNERPTFLLRDDPTEAFCRGEVSASAVLEPEPGSGGAASAGGSNGNGNGNGHGSSEAELPNGEVTTDDLPRFVGRLLDGLFSPEQSKVFGAGSRPTAEDVQSSVQALQLRAGPADVTAFHDFHNLQIAFDYVWQQLIDEGLIEGAKTLGRQIIEQGGDPVAALAAGGDPIKVLRQETQHVSSVQRAFHGTGIALKPVSPADPTDPINPQMPPPPPPIVRPPFVRPDKNLPERPEPYNLLNELEEMLTEKYKFEVFAPGSSNFGLLVTYRQRWELDQYQVGDLVHTLTLAPKETRKVVTKRTVKKERAVKETESNLRSRKDESSETMRDDAEIVQRASNKTNFNLNAKGSYNVGIAKGDSTMTLDKTAEASSQETKKSFHEAVLKASMELRSEKNWTFESKEMFEDETTDSSEITNPNDELTVTYLFYELQRRYKVTEHIHRLTPVVLVAMEVPNPNRRAIDRVLLAHSWIINRVLLDDRYRAPLDYLCTKLVGDELGLQQLSANVAAVRLSVEQIKKMHKDSQAQLAAREAAMTSAIQVRADRVASQNGEGFLEKGWEGIFGGGKEEDMESVRILEDMHKDAYERSIRDEKDMRMRLESEVAALTSATQTYAKAYAEHTNRLLEVAGLRAHFKENVLYYMQAIWNFTFQDQIFFSLCNVKVPRLTPMQKAYSVSEPAQVPLSIVVKPGQVALAVHADIKLTPGLDPETDFVTLAELAHVDQPMGCIGNYMVLPMKQSNVITDRMMMPYIDSELGLRDPDDLGSWTPEDFAKYARCLQRKLKSELSPVEYAALQNQLQEQYKKIVSNSRPMQDTIIVPSNSLYIEALPGAHPLLEDFKLAHRIMDVEKAKEDTRIRKLESLRYAGRILDNLYEDPEIEKKVVIDGGSDRLVVPTDDN